MFYCNGTRIKGTLYEDQYTCLFISLSILIRMRNISDRYFRENEKNIFCVQ